MMMMMLMMFREIGKLSELFIVDVLENQPYDDGNGCGDDDDDVSGNWQPAEAVHHECGGQPYGDDDNGDDDDDGDVSGDWQPA